MTGHALSVRQLRFRGRGANSLATRGRVEMALAAGASRLEGEAILCVRRIAIALPRVDNLSAALDAERSSAARPARDAVPANANAIFFADRAELLACLARDWCTGNASVCWWWPVLFPRDDFATIVRRAWLEDARPVPAALARLEAAGLAPKFLATLSPGDVATLRRNIVHTFHLSALDAAWGAIDITTADPGGVREPGKAAPWAPWIIPDPSLRTDCARVLIIATLLEHAPARVRSLSFALDVREWSNSEKIRSVAPLTPSSVSSRRDVWAGSQPPQTSRVSEPPSRKTLPFAEDFSTKTQPPQSAPVAVIPVSPLKGELRNAGRLAPATPPNAESASDHPAHPPVPERSANSRICEDHSRPARLEKSKPITPSAVVTDDVALPESIATNRDDPLNNSPTREVQPARSQKDGSVEPPAAMADGTVTLPSVPLPDPITSEWGGTLYLVNVAIALGLYGDFTTPARPGLALPLWDFLALIAGRMMGEEFAEDPLHRLFAKLSGRADDEPPGADFEPPTGETLAIWLDRICHEIEARVAASLGVSEHCDLRALVLNHHAKIETISARLDAYFSIASHPIELRVSGLDRDPGWVPAGGRSIYFHYD